MLDNPDPKQSFMLTDTIDTNLTRNLTFDRDIILDQIYIINAVDTDITLAVMVAANTLWSAQREPLTVPLGFFWAGNGAGFLNNANSLYDAGDGGFYQLPFIPIHCKAGDSINYVLNMAILGNVSVIILYHASEVLRNTWETIP